MPKVDDGSQAQRIATHLAVQDAQRDAERERAARPPALLRGFGQTSSLVLTDEKIQALKNMSPIEAANAAGDLMTGMALIKGVFMGAYNTAHGVLEATEANRTTDSRIESLGKALGGAVDVAAAIFGARTLESLRPPASGGAAATGAAESMAAADLADQVGELATATHRRTPEGITAKVDAGFLPANYPRPNNVVTRALEHRNPAVWVSEGQPSLWNRVWSGMVGGGGRGSASITFEVQRASVLRPSGLWKRWFGNSQRVIEGDVPIPKNADVRIPRSSN